MFARTSSLWLSLLGLSLAAALGTCSSSAPVQTTTTEVDQRPTEVETPPAERRQGPADRILAEIAGRENEPARDVFKNVQVMGDLPAGQFVRIMEMGFARSLGVRCSHCHQPGAWDSDDKRPKNTAREMWKMVQTINREILPSLQHIESDAPAVNCTTCHRGQVKPALNMEPAN